MNTTAKLSILGVGSAFPASKITNQFLVELGAARSEMELLHACGISERRTTLPLDYIRSTANKDMRKAPLVAQATITTLGLQACAEACQRAGIQPSQLGLLVADTTTPVQTTPSEAQRLGESLGLSVPAYDVLSGSIAGVQYLSTLLKFRPEKTPPYILFVSANTCSWSLNYAHGDERIWFGDGAFAAVLSLLEPGKIKVSEAEFFSDNSQVDSLTLDAFGFFSLTSRYHTFIEKRGLELANQFLKEGDKVILPTGSPLIQAKIQEKLKLPKEKCFSNSSSVGDILGAGSLAVLAEIWDLLAIHDKVTILAAGMAGGSGYARLEVVK